MADDVTLPTTGTGTATPVVATDQVAGSQHYQRVKLTDGTADSTTHIQSGVGSPVNGLRTAPWGAATATLANVAASASSVTLQASNTSRLGWMFVNDSTSAVYVKFGSAASTTSYTVKVAAGGYYELPFGYNGIITGIWDSATGNARVTEITA